LVKLGRNFTNTLVLDKLTKKQKDIILSGKEPLFSMNAFGLLKFKDDIEGQIRYAKKLGTNHIELDFDVPNNYLYMSKERIKKVRAFAEKNEVTLSAHLSYTNIGSCITSIQEEERMLSVGIHKTYIDFASKLGIKHLTTHPGRVAFYMMSPAFLAKIRGQFKRSLIEMADYASKRRCVLHLENNVSFDNIYVEPEDCIDILQEVRKEGAEIYFNFDIGHWLTREVGGSKMITYPPEKIIEKFPAGLCKLFHLNSFIVEGVVFHPPLHRESGKLKRKNLVDYYQIIKDKGVEIIILETAFKFLDEVKERHTILKEETKYIKEIFED